ncbi:MAG: penicillin-binding protein activator [Deltaproteobacteria bacterium]|nr:penicillin-binding protein activator [Deltaproteobacteria bacterium]MCB9785547.1 penicillin-binding protein activator [Deltaproteobacteria bacterium]
MDDGRRGVARALVGALALLVTGCGTTMTSGEPGAQVREPAATQQEPSPVASTPASRKLLDEARAARERGDGVRARRVLARLVREAPATSEATAARLDLAEDALAREDYDAARQWLPESGDVGRLEGAEHRLQRTLALAYEGESRYAEAARAWLAAREVAEPAARAEAGRGAARDLVLAGDPGAGRAVAREDGVPDGELRRLVEERVEPEQARQIDAGVAPDDPWRGWVDLLLAKTRAAAGDLAGAREAALRARGAADAGTAADADALLTELSAQDQVEARRVGVVLPLSGQFQRLGEAALEGIQLAVAATPEVKLVVRDSAGDPAQAAQAAQDLVLDKHVIALLGPIGEVESRAVAEVAGRFRVPHIVLTSAPESVEGLPTSHRIRLSTAELAAAIARYAVTDLGIQRVGILYPDNPTGTRSMVAFWDEIVRLGGEVRAVEGYPGDQNDFKAPIQKLIGAAKPGTGTFDFDALFIPDDALTVKRLVPFLKYWDMVVRTDPGRHGTKRRPAVQLLGSAGWNHVSVVDRGENLTENAIFADGFAHDPDEARSDAFARAFFARYRRKPTTFHAEVHDATALLAQAVLKVQGSDQQAREALLAALRSTRQFAGATGVIAVLDSGAVVRSPRLLTVDLDTIRPRLSEAEEQAMRQRRDDLRDQPQR